MKPRHKKITHIENKKWIVTNDSKQALFGGMFIYLDTTTGKMTGSTTCNRIASTYTLKEAKLSFSNISRTYKACKNSEAEVQFIRMLQSVDQFTIRKNKIQLKNDKQVVAILTLDSDNSDK